ncbi:MAG: SDR family oxidoreductase [Tepidiformaceae bacterium]
MTAGDGGGAVALIGHGGDAMRAIAVACAEHGVAVALATREKTSEQEFAVQSIANEVWVIGSEHFVRVMDAGDPTAAAAFADEVCDRLGRCKAAVVLAAPPLEAPIDELSPDEWEAALRAGLTVPFLAAQAFARVLERDGGGAIVFHGQGDETVLPAVVSSAALQAMATRLEATWGPRGVHVRCLDGDSLTVAAAQVLAALNA